MYLRDKYPEAYFSKLFYPLSLQLQPSEAASVLWLAYADSEAKALKSAAASSLSSPPQGQADLSCLSLTVQSQPSILRHLCSLHLFYETSERTHD